MSHVIKYWDYPADMDRKEIKSNIYMSILDDVMEEYPDEDRTENGWSGMADCAREIEFSNREFNSEKEALKYLESQPSYCNMAVKYLDGKGRMMYMIRTEYHC